MRKSLLLTLLFLFASTVTAQEVASRDDVFTQKLVRAFVQSGGSSSSPYADYFRPRATQPTPCGSTQGGRVWFDSTNNVFKGCDKTSYKTFQTTPVSPGGVSGQLQINNAGSFGGITLGGDCTFSQPNITCTKSGGVSFGTNAFTSTAYAPLASPSFTGTPAGPSFTFNGTAGAGFASFPAQSSNPAAPASGFAEFADSTGRRSWIRASDGFVRTWDATLTANRVYTLPDANSTFPVFSQVITFSGPTAARTVTLPDANFTVARTDAANTFTGNQTFSGQVLGSDGSASSPSLSLANSTGTGFYKSTTNTMAYAAGSSVEWTADQTGWNQRSTYVLCWASGAPTTNGADVCLKRPLANVLQATNGSSGGGAFMVGGSTGQPTCSVTIRGALWVVNSSAGVGDIVQACLKGTADTYSWVTVFTAP